MSYYAALVNDKGSDSLEEIMETLTKEPPSNGHKQQKGGGEDRETIDAGADRQSTQQARRSPQLDL